ncbi:MAG: hypothetical protein HRT47_06065 [Candidatus Caenarcaniphilales bacterium]|nr:hypothetical protein [Candidatus Caenarcaniphilales bacterium]
MKDRFSTFSSILSFNFNAQPNIITAPWNNPDSVITNPPELETPVVEEKKFDQAALTRLNKEKNLGLSDGAINLIYRNAGETQLTEQQIMTEAEKLYQTDSYGDGLYANSKLFNNLDNLNGRTGEISFNQEQKNLAWTSNAGQSTISTIEDPENSLASTEGGTPGVTDLVDTSETVVTLEGEQPFFTDETTAAVQPLQGQQVFTDGSITEQGKQMGIGLEENILNPELAKGADIQSSLPYGDPKKPEVQVYELQNVIDDLKDDGRISSAFDAGKFYKVSKNILRTPEIIQTRTDLSEETLPPAIMELENQDGKSITATLANPDSGLTMYLFETEKGIQAYSPEGRELNREEFEGFPTNRFLDPSVFGGPEAETVANEQEEEPNPVNESVQTPVENTVTQEPRTIIDLGMGPIT